MLLLSVGQIVLMQYFFLSLGSVVLRHLVAVHANGTDFFMLQNPANCLSLS